MTAGQHVNHEMMRHMISTCLLYDTTRHRWKANGLLHRYLWNDVLILWCMLII